MSSQPVPYSLLETLAAEAGCTYLSDLHTAIYAGDVRTALASFADPQRYTLGEWNDAVRYITGEEFSGCSAEHAQTVLLSYLSRDKIVC